MRHIKEIIESLQESPMYNISLSSKELFHSNFLAWLCIQEPEEMGRIFSAVLGRSVSKIRSATVLREKKNIDLQFDFEDGQKVIVENKVKSLPYTEQLLEYAEKYKKEGNIERILLTLSDPQHLYVSAEARSEIIVSSRDGRSYNWKVLTYEELSDLLSLADLRKGNFKPFVEDYVKFIKSLSEFEKLTRVTNDGVLRIGGDEFFDPMNNPIFKALKESNIRLADFYSKRVAEQLQVLLAESDATNEDDVLNSSIVLGDKAEVRVYRKLSERIKCSLELRLDGSYRKIIHVKHVKDKKQKLKYQEPIDIDEVFMHVRERSNWFEFDEVPDHRRDGSYQQKKEYLSFKNDARYMQIRLNASNSYDDVIQIFEAGLDTIDTLKNLLKDYDSPKYEA